MLVVAFGVQLEVARALRARLEAVPAGESLELRARDLGLSGLDREQRGGAFDAGAAPRLGARDGRGARLAVEVGVELRREVVPARDVRGFLGGMAGVGR